MLFARTIAKLAATTVIPAQQQMVRRVQPLQSLQLAKHLLQTDDSWIVPTNAFEPTRNLMLKAFAGGEPVVDWLLRDYIPTDVNARENVYRFAMSFPLQDGIAQGGMVFGKPKMDQPDCLDAGVMVCEYDPEVKHKSGPLKELKEIGSACGLYFDMIRKGENIGPFSNMFSPDTRTVIQRGLHFQEFSKDFHARVGPAQQHWYIPAVGVDPSSQGRGYGKQLMGKLGELADECKMDVYLECSGAFNKGFYEKMGFQEVGVGHLTDETDDASTPVYFMTRYAA